MNKFELFCLIFFALDNEWDKTQNEELGEYLSNANPFLFADIGSAISDCYILFCDFIGNKEITTENSFDIANSYVKSLTIKSVSSAFECINKDDWVKAVNKYLSQPHKGDNI